MAIQRDTSGRDPTWLKLIHRLQCLKWHQWGRFIAVLALLDQALGPVSAIPSSEAIVVVALGALFAPVPKGGD